MKYLLVIPFVLMFCSSTWAQLGVDTSSAHGYASILKSETGAPDGGYLLNDVDTTPNANFMNCSGGYIGTLTSGYNCLIQGDIGDTTGYLFGVAYKNGVDDAFPLFRVKREGATIAQLLWVQPNINGSRDPYKFGDPTNTFNVNCIFCMAQHAVQDGNNAVIGMGVYGNPSTPTSDLVRMYGATTKNVGTGLLTGTLRMTIPDAGQFLLGGSTVTTAIAGGEIGLQNNKAVRWLNNTGTSYSNFYIMGDANNNMLYSALAASGSHVFQFNGAQRFLLDGLNSGTQLHFLNESSTDPVAPGANGAKVYTRDNGAGKTQLVVRFNTGAVQVIATEP